MRRLTVLIALPALALGGAAASADESGPDAQQSASAAISMGDNFFNPVKKRVKPRTRVTWTNNGQNPHTVTAKNGSFDSGNLSPGQSFSRTYKNLGKYPYFCRIHANMTGVIKVCKKVDGKLVCKKPS